MLISPSLRSLPVVGLAIFLGAVVAIALRHFGTLFWDHHGWRHRVAGGLLLAWLVVGCVGCCCLRIPQQQQQDESLASYPLETDAPERYNSVALFFLIYDVALGVLGITATITAALDFPHRYVSNAPGQSGTLSETAMVTQAEMLEHLFYQCLNLCQALYLHVTAYYNDYYYRKQQKQQVPVVLLWETRWLALFLATAPWLVRHRFPVHSFSQNWKNQKKLEFSTQEDSHPDTQQHQQQEEIALLLYKIKKAQYLFYKHVILHGVNLTVFLAAAVDDDNNYRSQPQQLVRTPAWRVFWICLNASYVMEFFLQSLVRRRVMAQSTMLTLNRLLMAVSSVAAVQSVVRLGRRPGPFAVRWDLCLASLALNWVQRKHDVVHTMLIATVAMVMANMRWPF